MEDTGMLRALRRRTRGALAITLAAAIIPTLIATTGRAAVPTFAQPVAMPGGAGTNEPSLQVAPDGIVYASGIHGLVSHSPVWRSKDGGVKYDNLTFQNSNYNRFPGGGDTALITSPGTNAGDPSRLYFMDLWAGSNSVMRSDDGGETWAMGTPFSTLPLTDRQWMAIGERDPATHLDTVYVIYHFIQAPSSFAFAASKDGGMTWLQHALPAGASGGLPGQIVSDGKFVGFNQISSGQERFYYSNDAGVTWAMSLINKYNPAFDNNLTAVALDGNEMWCAFVGASDFSINIQHSSDRGRTWDDDWTTISDGGTNVFPWIAARDGKVSVAWYRSMNSAFGTNPNNATNGKWTLGYSEKPAGSTTFTAPVDASAGGDGLRRIVKSGPICTAGLSCMSGRELGDFLQVAIDATGHSYISYVNVLKGGSTVVKQA
jgi:photosystem II stability/assembly factor-like uncharacterized protein